MPKAPRPWVAPAVAVAALLALWQAVVSLGIVPSFLLPSPTDVVRALMDDAPLLASHALVTMAEALAGLALGVAAGFAIAVAMERFGPL